MALFAKKEKKVEKEEVKKPKTAVKSAKKEEVATVESDKNLSGVILKPRITEKAAIKADEANAYTFVVHKSATKKDIALAIEKIYKIVPRKINIIINPRKVVRNRKGTGFKSGIKKAVVFLKKGDSIDFV
jgi:large subunit ribosomal protein L23